MSMLQYASTGISIHAPHEGERLAGDNRNAHGDIYFNPRSPRGGATVGGGVQRKRNRFQSTLPTRGSDETL